MTEDQKILKMTFDPNTIQHLGIKMYSQLPAAIAELVANAYDADASEVHIKLSGEGEEKTIGVADNGLGMSFSEVNDFFLKIGRNRRSENLAITPSGRRATGKKGLGKLALFGIGEKISVRTKKASEKNGIYFSLIWGDLKNWDRKKNGPDYVPESSFFGAPSEEHWTEIIISSLKRKTNFPIAELPVSLSRMFNFLDDNFRVFLHISGDAAIEITNSLKYDSLTEQFSWEFPQFAKSIENDYSEKENIKGRIITSERPLRPGQRGVTLFANGRMVNAPEFFGISESSIFFSYASGWLDVDFMDADNGEDDSISTNRQALDWETEKTIPLRNFLQVALGQVHKEWREKRKEKNKKDAQVVTGINRDKWLGSIPDDKALIIDTALEEVSDPDSIKNFTEVVETAFYGVAPEYAELHWRYLHPAIHAIAKDFYEKQDYFRAAREASLLYVQRVRDMSGYKDKKGEDVDLIFNPASGVIMVTDCTNETEQNIQMGQQHLSRGIIFGCRNPLTHNPEFDKHLIDTGLFDRKVCLDMLAMISHLFTRLDSARIRT